jgi:hypothetical protein
MTTWHNREPLTEALWYLLSCTAPDDAYFDDCGAAVGITIGSSQWAVTVRAALAAPYQFVAKILGQNGERTSPG